MSDHVAKFALVAAAIAAILPSTAVASSGSPTVAPRAFAARQGQALSMAVGGADVQPTTRTVPHWWGSSRDAQTGTTYGYNMVGANPATCTGAGCDVTITVDITPLVVRLGGMTFSGRDVVAPTLASPLFSSNDYAATPAATDGGTYPFAGFRGPGGVLSQEDAGVPLQLQDATMRAQFGATGQSRYHVRLRPNVLPAVTVDVPDGQGALLRSPRGVIVAGVDPAWFEQQIRRLSNTAEPTHLALYLSDDTVEFCLHPSGAWCVYLGFHGAHASGASDGNAPVQTYAWATYESPGMFAGTDPRSLWIVQDVNALSHEISEWADDPFIENTVAPWPLFPGFAGSPCSTLLETGDPVDFAGFAIGANDFRQAADPDGTQAADGHFHPEDEATLPWFLHEAPNTTSELTQAPSANGGRYTLMGTLNASPGLTAPPAPCA